jgi:hypothetical protein
MRYLNQYLDRFNFSRVHFHNKPALSVSTMSLDDANRVALDMSSAWSPENLTCDGELSRDQVQARARMIRNAAYELITRFPDLTIPQWSEDLFETPVSVRVAFRAGQKISIDHPKLGGYAVGTILKVNRVKARVEFPAAGIFSVPFEMMKIVA